MPHNSDSRVRLLYGECTAGHIESAASVTSPLDQQILRRQVFVPSSRADYCRLARDPRGIWLPHWTHLELLLPKSSVARTPATPAADAIAYTQTTCSTGAMPTPHSSAANTMDKPCSPTWQAFTPTQPHKPGNKT